MDDFKRKAPPRKVGFLVRSARALVESDLIGISSGRANPARRQAGYSAPTCSIMYPTARATPPSEGCAWPPLAGMKRRRPRSVNHMLGQQLEAVLDARLPVLGAAERRRPGDAGRLMAEAASTYNGPLCQLNFHNVSCWNHVFSRPNDDPTKTTRRERHGATHCPDDRPRRMNAIHRNDRRR